MFRNKILPLLQEYFYGDWEKVCLALGDNPRWGKAEEHRFVQLQNDLSSKKLFGENVHFLEEKATYRIHSALVEERYREFPREAFIEIYEASNK